MRQINQILFPLKKRFEKFGKYHLVEKWLKEGKLHRENGPALIYRNLDGSLIQEEWYMNNELHREDGPAVQYYQKNGFTERYHELDCYDPNNPSLNECGVKPILASHLYYDSIVAYIIDGQLSRARPIIDRILKEQERYEKVENIPSGW